jgi:hypothetical protein
MDKMDKMDKMQNFTNYMGMSKEEVVRKLMEAEEQLGRAVGTSYAETYKETQTTRAAPDALILCWLDTARPCTMSSGYTTSYTVHIGFQTFDPYYVGNVANPKIARLPRGTPMGFGLGTGRDGHDGCYHYHHDVAISPWAPVLADVQVGQVHRWYDVHTDGANLCSIKGPGGSAGKGHGLQCLNLFGDNAAAMKTSLHRTDLHQPDFGVLKEWAASFAALWKAKSPDAEFWKTGIGSKLLENDKLGQITDTDLLKSFNGAGWIYSFAVGMRDPLLGHIDLDGIYQQLLQMLDQETVPGGFLLFDFNSDAKDAQTKALEQMTVIKTTPQLIPSTVGVIDTAVLCFTEPIRISK